MKKLLVYLLLTSMIIQPITLSYGAETTTTENTSQVHSDELLETLSKDSSADNPDTNLENPEEEQEPSTPTETSSALEEFLAGDQDKIRLSGKDRIETAVAISRFQNTLSEKVLLVDADNYPDALTASNITQGKYSVLLVHDRLSDNILEEITRLKATEVYILGGSAAVSNEVEEQAKKIEGIESVKRISGKDRYETAAKIFQEGSRFSILFASGENFADALSAAPLVGLDNRGLLLTRKNEVASPVVSLFKEVEKENFTIVGGGARFTEELRNAIVSTYGFTSSSRISGSNRFITSTKIAEKFRTDTVIVASGMNFPDALAATTMSQKIQAPILLVDKAQIDYSVQKYLKDSGISKMILVGGEGVISKSTERKAHAYMIGTELPSMPDFNRNAVLLSDTVLYKDETFTEKVGSLPKYKIVTVLEQSDVSAKINYDKTTGWVGKEALKNYKVTDFGKRVNSVPYISQLYPIYAPNGCEPTALLMGLKGKGYTDIDLRTYLDRMPKTSSNPRYGYVGVPYNVEQRRFQTIDPEPLTKYGQQYGNVVNTQGKSIEDLIIEIQNGNTVVVYATLGWNRPYFKTLSVSGSPERRIWNNHAVLLTGYDPIKKSFYVADPYNHENYGGNRKRSFYYWKAQSVVDACYNYDNRRFSLTVR